MLSRFLCIIFSKQNNQNVSSSHIKKILLQPEILMFCLQNDNNKLVGRVVVFWVYCAFL